MLSKLQTGMAGMAGMLAPLVITSVRWQLALSSGAPEARGACRYCLILGSGDSHSLKKLGRGQTG